MIKGPGSSSTVDETDTPLVLGKEKTGIRSPTLSRGANGLGGLPGSLAVAIEVSFSLSARTPSGHWVGAAQHVERGRPVCRSAAFNQASTTSGTPHCAVPADCLAGQLARE